MNAIVVVVIAGCVFGVMEKNRSELEKSSLEDLQSFSNVANRSVQAQFYERYGDVQAFAINPRVQAPTKAEIVDALDNYSALYGIYDLIVVADLNGNIVGVNGKDSKGKEINSKILYGRSLADAEWFKNTVQGRFTEDKSKGLTGTYFEDVNVDPIVSEVYGEKRIGTSFSAIIKDKTGKPIGVISNRAGSRWFEGELEATFDAVMAQGYTHSSVTLINAKGIVIGEAEGDENGKANILRDFSVLGALNLVDLGVASAVAVSREHKAGNGFGFHKRKKIETADGYTPVTGKKWIDSIGWSVIVRDSKAEVVAKATEMFVMTCGILGVLFLLTLAGAFFFSRALAGRLRAMAAGLNEGAAEVSQVAQQLASSSNQLSSSASQQAAAVQQTVASIDEVSAMVAKNADNAKRSQEISSDSAQTAQKGKAAVTEVITAIDEINDSNREIVKQVEEGNRQISEIVKLITEIGNKTKVINDIVFQTKLLSFNASVEAARAGEHGKGFAVVAEEVGNLAQMSGNAAKEISQMLDSSIAKVDQIVVETKGRVARLTSLSQEKVQAGTVTARRCGEVLDEIVRSVGEVNVMVAEIATASKEQAQGVSEINKAMNQMDQVTQANASSSQDAAAGAERLRDQSHRLSGIVAELSLAVEGGAAGLSGGFSSDQAPAAVSGKVVQFPVKTSAPRPALKAAAGAEGLPRREDKRFEEV